MEGASAPGVRVRRFPAVAAKNGVDWLFVAFIVIWQLFMLVVRIGELCVSDCLSHATLLSFLPEPATTKLTVMPLC